VTSGGGQSRSFRTLDEEPHLVHYAVGKALEMVIIPGQQFGSMEVGLAKEGLCLREGLGSHNQQLLWAFHEPIGFKITAQVKGRPLPQTPIDRTGMSTRWNSQKGERRRWHSSSKGWSYMS